MPFMDYNGTIAVKGRMPMPRPRKCRKVCYFPETLAFTPAGDTAEREAVILTVDEYETIRLIDHEGL